MSLVIDLIGQLNCHVTITLKMTTAQVVETSVTVKNSSFQNYTHPDDHTRQTKYDLAERPRRENVIFTG